MPANTSPIFGLTPVFGKGAAILTANTAVDGTGSVTTLVTAGANGTYLRKLRCRAVGTNIQTAVRVFINDGAGTAAANSALIIDMVLPATTAANNAAIGPPIDIPLNFPIPTGYKVNVCIGTTVATGWQFSVEAQDY